MNTSEIKKLLEDRFAMIDIIHSCRSSINEISLSTIDTISLSDLRDKIDFEKYPKLQYLFSQENISYLRPYHGKLMWLEDDDLGIVSRALVTAEICNLLGVDLTGRHSGSGTDLCDKRKIEIVKKHLIECGVDVKPITYLSDVIDARLLWANNERLYLSKNNISKEDEEKKVFFEEKENELLIVIHYKSGTSNFSYIDDVYDLLCPYQRDLREEMVISNEILDKEYYDKVSVVTSLTLEDAIKKTISSDLCKFDGDNFYFGDINKNNPFVYDGDKNDKDTFVAFIADKMRNIKDATNITVFVMEFGSFILDYCVGHEIEELNNIMCVANDILYGDMYADMYDNYL